MRLRIEQDNSAKAEWRYAIDGNNNENMVTSEGYTSRQDAERGFDDLVRNVLLWVADDRRKKGQ